MNRLLSILLIFATGLTSHAVVKSNTYAPAREVFSTYNADNDSWEESYTRYNSYDAQGRLASYIDEYFDSDRRIKTVIGYDEHGNEIEKNLMDYDAANDSWLNTFRYSNSYDSQVPDYNTGSYMYLWNSQWNLKDSNRNTVKRNDKGLVYYLEESRYILDGYMPSIRMNALINTDCNKVLAISVDRSCDGKNNWKNHLDIRNIEWNKFNGQVLGFDIFDYCCGENRIAKADLYSAGELIGTVKGEYSNDFEGGMTIEYLNGSSKVFSQYYTDAITGSCEMKSTTTYVGNGDSYTEEVLSYHDYDEYGNCVEKGRQFLHEGELVEMDAVLWEYNYNEYGVPEETVESIYAYSVGRYIPQFRIQAYDFEEVGALKSVECHGPQAVLNGRTLQITAVGHADCSLISLDGRIVAAASGSDDFDMPLDGIKSGIYIVRLSDSHSNNSFKIAVR